VDAPDYAAAVEKDAAIWDSITEGQLYWIPGTRIIGAISFGAGGTLCPTVPVPPANQLVQGNCAEHRILDDFGHGSMTASRMAAGNHSLNPDGLIVSIEAGDAAKSLDFVVQSGFIDVVSNSWGSLLPTVAEQELARQVEAAGKRALFLFASGNGLGFINGVVGQPTYISPTFTPSVLIVGAHDNGYATLWHGAPPHIVADGYGGWRAHSRDLVEYSPSAESCCTSTSAPYASGGAAAILLEARKILGDTRTGLRGDGDEGILAEGSANATLGPLADGKLTLGELKAVLLHTANPRPPITSQTSDDGLLHWTATPGDTPTDPWLGDNPYCLACWTSPVPLSQIPSQISLVASIGYGAITTASVRNSAQVFSGQLPMPERTVEDQYFAVDHELRTLLQP
jgi:hypothetical protein